MTAVVEYKNRERRRIY